MKIFRGANMLLIGGTALLMTAQASATIIYAGQAVPIAMPSDVNRGVLHSDMDAYVFLEQSSHTLAVSLTLGITSPGFYDSTGSLSVGTIAAGTPIDVYMVHADPITLPPSGYQTYIGSITFDATQYVAGIMVGTDRLRAADSRLGASGTAYANPSEPNTGLELNTPGCTATCGFDKIFLSPDSRTVSFHLATSDSIDQFRIVVASAPEPSTWALLGAGLAAMIGFRRGLAAARR